MDDSILSIPLQELGNKLVEQLGPPDNTDLLSRWMAHQLASDLQAAVQLPAGPEKTVAEMRCRDLILQFWQHRQSLPSGRSPFESFDQIFDLLERLHPNSPQQFYIETYFEGLRGASHDSATDKPSAMQQWTGMAQKIDRVVRIWLAAILREMTNLAEQHDTQEWVKTASSLAEKNEAHVIHLVLEDSIGTKDTGNHQTSSTEQFRIEQIKKRLEELSEFQSMHRSIVQLYTNELKRLEQT